MTQDYIRDKVRQLINKYDSRNPIDIIREENIIMKYFPYETKLLGMYAVIDDIRFLFLNGNIDDFTTRMVLAHELGHDQLHRSLASISNLKEYEMFHVKDEIEYQANLFAAELLLDDSEVYELAKNGYSDIEIASLLGVDVNMLLFKIRIMFSDKPNIYNINNPEPNFLLSLRENNFKNDYCC
ncbi:MAG: ImmA/IrrE family metallo-endopeptidase [Tissierellia bacterium]|nr:ImmA/IrrE family metallo-endopeptidase [Tissierellia bacterium]